MHKEIQGWIDPNGIINYVDESGHRFKAEQIVEEFGLILNDYEDELNHLINNGWILFSEDTIIGLRELLTNEMIEIIQKLVNGEKPIIMPVDKPKKRNR